MKLTATQFRLLKSRAKTRFAELGRKKLEAKNSLRSFSLFLHYVAEWRALVLRGRQFQETYDEFIASSRLG
jgi:hypothetical protein